MLDFRKAIAEIEENSAAIDNLPITEPVSRVIVPDMERRKEFAKVKSVIILKNTRLERWLNCWLEYWRDAYKASQSSDEKILISTVGKMWRGVLNEEVGNYSAILSQRELSAVIEYAGGKYESETSADEVDAKYNRQSLIKFTKSVMEGVVAKYPEVFDRLLDQQLMPVEIGIELVQLAARRNGRGTFDTEDILEFTGGVIYTDKDGVNYLLSDDVVLMMDIINDEDGANYD